MHISSKVYRQTLKDIRTLIKESQGLVLIYLFIFYLMKKFIFYPLGKTIWAYTIQSSKAPYITNGNFSILLQSPQLLIVGLILILGFCMITIWEISGIILSMEYILQRRRPKIRSIFVISLKRVTHLLKPRNWLFFAYLCLVLPIVNLYNATGFLGKITVPEFIMDFIKIRWYLYLPTMIVFFIFILITLRWFYAIQSIVLKRYDFIDARRESVKITKGRLFYQAIDMVIFSIVETLRIALVPALVCGAFILILLYCTQDLTSANICANLTFNQVFLESFLSMTKLFLSISVTAYLVVTYKYLLHDHGLNELIYLPPKAINPNKKVHKYYFLKRMCYGALLLGCFLLYGACNFALQVQPDIIKLFNVEKKIVAHKGFCTVAPENTMEAFKAAYDSNSASMIELDVRESKDGIPIVIHNATTQEATGINEEVYNLTYEEIRSQVASYGFAKSDFPNAYIPTLEEVLAEYGNKIPLLIEIKMDPRTPDLPKKIVELIHKYDCKDNCMIHSGSYEALEKVKEVDPDIPCGLIIAFGAGYYYTLPSTDFFSVEHSFVDDDMLENIHSVGKKVFAWTVNNDDSIKDMKDVSVDGVITDFQNTVYESFHTNDTLVNNFIDSIADNISIQENDNSSFENGDY